MNFIKELFYKIVNFLRFVLVFGAVSLILLLVFDKIVMPWYTGQGQEYTLENLKTMSFKKARARLNDIGLYADVVDSVIADTLPPGYIYNQFPEPGSKVKQGREIRFVITKSHDNIKMPNLIGMDFEAAKLKLGRKGIKAEENIVVTEEYTEDKPEGVVAKQSINPGIEINPTAPIQIVVSKGAPSKVYQVPDLIGNSLEKAKQRIKQSDLEVGMIEYKEVSDLNPHTIVKQVPKPGEKFFKKKKVNLIVTK